MAGAAPRYVPLRGDDWRFDVDELAKAFNSRTKAIVINTPHNPTGKVFSHDELRTIAELCLMHNVVAITDEVYEHILYDDASHVRLATLPGMAERTVTISSLGKTFSVTGWKIGWAMGPAALVHAVNQAHQFITYAVASPLQAAAATALNLPFAFFENLQSTYQARRDRMLDVLHGAGFKSLSPGSYFIMIDWRAWREPQTKTTAVRRWLIQEVGVACIPASPFYQEADKQLGQYLPPQCAKKTRPSMRRRTIRQARQDLRIKFRCTACNGS
jgi:N-succinyldiaminopimelate aminotransferase